MSTSRKATHTLLAIALIVFGTLACSLGGIPGMQPIAPIATQSLVPTPECGGNISGHWYGSATGTMGDIRYSMDLVQNGCSVTGTQTSTAEGRETVTSPVTGTVDQGVFHFSETATREGPCYWSGAMTIQWPGNLMTGQVTNCSQPTITLNR